MAQLKLEEDSPAVVSDLDRNNIVDALQLLQQLIDQKYGKGSDEDVLLTHSIKMLKYPVGHKGARFPTAAWNLCMYYTANSVSEKTYNVYSKEHTTGRIMTVSDTCLIRSIKRNTMATGHVRVASGMPPLNTMPVSKNQYT